MFKNFKSIRWRFVVIYFTLVLIALVVLGFFMLRNLEISQENSVEKDIENTIETMLLSSDSLSDPNWEDRTEDIQKTLENWNVNPNYQIYGIFDPTAPKILASVNINTAVEGENAYSYRNLEPELILEGFKEIKSKKIIRNDDTGMSQLHLSFPIVNSNGDTDGIFYVIGDLSSINDLILDSRDIFLNALGLSLIVTIFLGLLLGSTITGPIINLTDSLATVAKGDYNQQVKIDSDDEIGQLAGTFNQLTGQLQRTIANMEIERGKLDTIFQYMQEGVVAIDRENRVIHINKVASNTLGIAPDSDQKLNLRSLNVYGVDYNNRSTLEGENQLEFRGRYYNILYGPYMDRNTPSGIILVLQDVTKEHLLDKMRKDFVANVSHELKTPLTTIKTYTETILMGDIDPETNNNFLRVIDEEADRMDNLVQGLLQLSNIDYQGGTLDRELFRFSDMLKSIISSLESMRQQYGVQLKITNHKKDLEIYTDRQALEKILMNIISNGYKYSGQDGSVAISINEKNENLVVTIKDNGIGIPYADQKYIFDRFYRVEKGRSRAAGGTGLGLAIAKELTQSLGGDLTMKSIPDVGTSFILTLPKEYKYEK